MSAIYNGAPARPRIKALTPKLGGGEPLQNSKGKLITLHL